MKSLKSTKALALLLSATLVTSCFVGGTFARYITTTSSEDSARVAVWGINADDVEMNLFTSEYDVNGNKVAKSWDGDKIIAPGTSMSSQFSIVNLDDTLAPEVMYEVKVELDDTEIDQRILDNPSIQWKLDNNAWGTWESTKADILALSGDASGRKVYAPLEIAEEFAAGKTHTIAWQWMLDDNNVQDTTMGNQAVDEDIIAKINVKVTARQVQEENNGLIEHNHTIPVGAKYYSGENLYVTGDVFPTIQTGDIYIYGDYEYRYNEKYDVADWTTDTSLNGWSAKIIEYSKNEYDNILTTINNKNITNLDYTFSGSNLSTAPSLPNTVTSMVGTFSVCDNLTVAPELPPNVTDISFAFTGTNITTAPNLPNTITNMTNTFANCTFLTIAPELPNQVINLTGTFKDTNITTAPTIPETTNILIRTFENCTNLSGTLVVNANFDDDFFVTDAIYGTQISEISGTCSEQTKINILNTK